MILDEFYILNNGVKIPKLGLGTWLINNKVVASVVKNAIELGYRHIDTAQAYMNEEGVGLGIRESGIKRNELFVTSKVHAGYKTYESAMDSINKSLDRLNIEYIDLMIIHGPQPWLKFRKKERFFDENIEVWRALEDAYKLGKIKAIGVSNFLEDDIQNIIDHCTIKPMINQILLHIGRYDKHLVDYCQKNDILVEAYSPIAHGKALKHKQIIAIAEKYKVTPAQLCIRYVLELNTIALPKSSNIEHMKDNAKVDFIISKSDMEKLNKINRLKYGLLKLFPVYNGK